MFTLRFPWTKREGGADRNVGKPELDFQLSARA